LAARGEGYLNVANVGWSGKELVPNMELKHVKGVLLGIK
jgi:hypothetical protein